MANLHLYLRNYRRFVSRCHLLEKFVRKFFSLSIGYSCWPRRHWLWRPSVEQFNQRILYAKLLKICVWIFLNTETVKRHKERQSRSATIVLIVDEWLKTSHWRTVNLSEKCLASQNVKLGNCRNFPGIRIVYFTRIISNISYHSRLQTSESLALVCICECSILQTANFHSIEEKVDRATNALNDINASFWWKTIISCIFQPKIKIIKWIEWIRLQYKYYSMHHRQYNQSCVISG